MPLHGRKGGWVGWAFAWGVWGMCGAHSVGSGATSRVIRAPRVGTPANPPKGSPPWAVNGVDPFDNYNVTGAANLSNIVKFENNVLPMPRFPYADDSQGDLNEGFGAGPFKRSAVFTVSLIEPNFIFTTMENATLQTFDVQLMWGDTSEKVRGISGNPVQFSIIASP